MRLGLGVRAWHRLLALLLAVACPALLAARDAPPGFDGFIHRAWTSEDGVPDFVQALAQTPDGYLWLGTYEGLFRFDGVSFEGVAVAPGHPPGAIPVSALTVTRRGVLWVGYAGGAGVEAMRGGRLARMHMPDPPGEVTGIHEGQDGAIWVVGGRGRRALKRFANGRWDLIDARRGVPDNEHVASLIVARDGVVWVAMQTRLLFLRPGAARFEATPLRIREGASMAQDARGRIWLADQSGTRMLADYPAGATRAADPRVRPPVADIRYTSLMADPGGALWGTTYTGGVFRIAATDTRDAAPPPVFRTDHGLSSNQAMALLRDREGSIWVASEAGLDQFRPANLVALASPPRGSPTGYLAATDTDGVTWFIARDRLYRVDREAEPVVVSAGVAGARALCADPGGGVWAGLPGRMVRLRAGRAVETRRLPEGEVFGCGVDGRGRLWVARFGRGIGIAGPDGWRDIAVPGPERRRPQDVVIDRMGRPVIILDRRAVMRIEDGRTRLWTNETIGVAGITVVYDSVGGLIIGGGTGLARWNGRGFDRLSIDRHPWLRGVRGIVQTANGTTWLVNNRGVIRIASAELDRAFRQPRAPIAYALFDEQDGFVSRTQGADGLQLTQGGDGRLWVLTRQGVIRIDPARLRRNTTPPLVAISAVTADGVRHIDPTALTLPAGTNRLAIDYSGLSLAEPGRVRFRVRLSGVDRDWIDPGSRRQAFYTNLGPGRYRFEVMAANNDGVWNPKAAVVALTIPPTFVQTPLFALLCLIAAGAVLTLLFRLRLRGLSRRIRAQMAERLHERERIARELHDTLLQSIQALILRLHLVAEEMPKRGAPRRAIEDALDRAEEMLAEGRDRVRDLRAPTGDADALDQRLLEIARKQGFAAQVKVSAASEGQPRQLDPIVFSEVASVANEALFNIWKHAGARAVSIQIVWRAQALVVRFRDDGAGISPDILRSGEREGHFGLPSMRERAHRIGGELSITPGPGGGTDVTLIVPASIAYARGGDDD